ncbi:MAG TPA: hypothetical protein DEA55_09215 [Rhodospirillaceae bacterium]|nr:hypothetical protein [Rhodospirillaceae bacterium]
MRIALDKLLEKLGVSRVLSPYETQPWVHYDAEKGITCSAEVRMGPNREDVEAEIQFLKDEEDSGDDDGTQSGSSGGRQQIMLMRATPLTDGQWSPVSLYVKGKDYVGEIYDWEGKGCNFFRACIEAVSMSVLPDVDALIEKELSDDESWGGGRRGKIGRKSPSIKPGALLGMKK